MLSIRVGNTTIHFEPLIIAISIILVALILNAIILNVRKKRCSNQFNRGEYDKVIVDGQKLLKVFTRYKKRYAQRNTVALLEYIHYILAVSYYAKSNDRLFLEHIDLVTQYNDMKNFWLALYYLQQDDFETSQEYYDRITSCEETQTYQVFYDATKMDKKGQTEYAKIKMHAVYNSLKYPVLKELADGILK